MSLSGVALTVAIGTLQYVRLRDDCCRRFMCYRRLCVDFCMWWLAYFKCTCATKIVCGAGVGVAVLFTARLCVMQRAVLPRPFIQSVKCVLCDEAKRNLCPHSYTTWKTIHPNFLTKWMVVGGDTWMETVIQQPTFFCLGASKYLSQSNLSFASSVYENNNSLTTPTQHAVMKLYVHSSNHLY